MVLGVNDKTNRACLVGRQTDEFFEGKFPRGHLDLGRFMPHFDPGRDEF
jgi:hypothetical protein